MKEIPEETTINDVPMKYRVPLMGTYNVGVLRCPDCNNSFICQTDSKIIGFAELNGCVVLIQECQECFERCYYHVSNKSSLETYLLLLDNERNKNE